MTTLDQQAIHIAGLLMEANVFTGNDEDKAQQSLDFIRTVSADYNAEGMELSYPRSNTRVYVSYIIRDGVEVLHMVDAYRLSRVEPDDFRDDRLAQLNHDLYRFILETREAKS